MWHTLSKVKLTEQQTNNNAEQEDQRGDLEDHANACVDG
jgi:hypothetical protein